MHYRHLSHVQHNGAFITHRELLPRLPVDGVFSVNTLIQKGGVVYPDSAFWQWQDDRGLWHMYTPIDNKIVEVSPFLTLLLYDPYIQKESLTLE